MAVNDIVMGAAGASGPATYIEDVFSNWLYTSSGSNRSIVNNIDLSTKGGMVLFKGRTSPVGGYGWGVFDTNRGVQKALRTNTNEASFTDATSLTAFNANGFSLGIDNNLYVANAFGSGEAVSWTFRKQPKFFDIVTYTGNGSARTIAHNLGSAPGCIIVKRTDTTANWCVYHRAIDATAPQDYRLSLNLTDTRYGQTVWNNTAPTSSVFSLGTGSDVNANGGTYVAYVFAHNAGGFGATGTDNVISCGSFTTNSAGVMDVNLGYEPQYILYKSSSTATNWNIIDSMRGLNVTQGVNLYADASAAESTSPYPVQPTATGFKAGPTPLSPLSYSQTYIYIAIRRPMKTPTTGTSVFSPVARTGTNANATVTGGSSPTDAVLIKNRGASIASLFSSRLTGTGYLVTSSTAVEVAAGTTILQANPWDVMNGVKIGNTSTITNASGNTYINYLFTRASGFFDVVCYTGTGALRTINHNLGVAPELMIIKLRDFSGGDWITYPNDRTKYILLNSTSAQVANGTYWNSTAPTASVFTVSSGGNVNELNKQLVAYLFATVAGVSKVGSYTGNGSSQTINCSFTTGARFVMIKCTSAPGAWFVYDSARGINAGNDPNIQLDSTGAEQITGDEIDADNSGFVINQTGEQLNATGATYIFLAIA